MEDQTNIIKSMNKQRVPVMVLFVDDEDIGGYHAMEFYAFHDSMFCPIFEVDTSPTDNYTVEDLPLQNVPFRAHPFTGFSSCPEGCSFASVGDQLYLVGGYTHSSHIISTISGNPKKADLNIPLMMFSSRVLRFDCQQFVNSLGENKGKEKMKFSELNDEVVHENWETCAPLSIPRRKASLLHLDGKLWAVGGIFDNKAKLFD
ncbi:hypothetical protein Leryth_026921 [Lithospermum erythrorhizon]|nr:hypothetical protein Leryth_026921 [Lithospermum erythrorhizon]